MAHRAPRLSWLTIPALGVLFGCVSGQTGSPICTPPGFCICSTVQGRLLVRGTVQSVELVGSVKHATVGVDEILSPLTANDVVVGDVIGGMFTAGPYCSSNGYAPVAGDQILAVYHRGSADRYPDCIEYQQCTGQKCGLEPTSSDPDWDVCDAQCTVDTAAACRAHRNDALIDGDLWLARWQDVIELGETETIPAEAVSQLVSADQCYAHFEPQAGSCNDVIENFGCALGSPSRASHWSTLGVLAAILGIVWRRQRSRLSGATQHRTPRRKT